MKALKIALKILREDRFYPSLGDSPNYRVDVLPVLQNQECWDCHYAEPGHDRGIFVRVEFSEGNSSGVFLGQSIYYWRDHSTGTTPRCPAINQYNRMLRYERFKVRVCDRYGMLGFLWHYSFCRFHILDSSFRSNIRLLRS